MSFSNPSLDGYLVKSALEVAIDGDVRITRADDVLYEEEMGPVVELAEQLNAWLSKGPRGDTAFEYRSIESSVPVMMWFRPVDSGLVLGNSAPDGLGPTSESEPVDPLALTQAATRFVQQVISVAPQEFGLDLSFRGLKPEPD